jgi:hypothetical protein
MGQMERKVNKVIPRMIITGNTIFHMIELTITALFSLVEHTVEHLRTGKREYVVWVILNLFSKAAYERDLHKPFIKATHCFVYSC